MDTSNAQDPIQSQKAGKLRKLLSQGMLELIKIDRDIAMDILEIYRSKWLDIMDTPPPVGFQTLEDYLAFRRDNAGTESVHLLYTPFLRSQLVVCSGRSLHSGSEYDTPKRTLTSWAG